ncbi:MAG: MFS transporter, partial [Cyanobacteria bacterium J06632_22]
WVQVGGLAAVQGAISLTWVIYNLYLLKLLTGLGFPEALGTILLVLENALAAVMEPLMGSLSDQSQRWVGSRFPQIALGIILAAACFIGIPLAAWLGSSAIRLLLPVALVLWALAMTVFRSPALSLLGRYAFESQLPQAAGLLTLVGGVTGAMAPLAGDWLLSLGAGTTFTIGSVVLLGAALVLRQVNPAQTIRTPQVQQPGPPPRINWSKLLPNLALVFGVGIGVALGLRLLLQLLPVQYGTLSALPGKRALAVIFITVALTALPMGNVATRLGNRLAMGIGLVGLTGISGLLLSASSAHQVLLLAIFAGAAFSLVSNGTLPFALSMVPPQKSGLGTGLYFSGGAVALSLFGAGVQRLGSPSPPLGLGLAAAGFGLAIACLALARQPAATGASPTSPPPP